MSDSILKADIFFVITSISVILVTCFVVYAIFEIIKILKDIRKVSDRFSKEGEKIADDVSEFREELKQGKNFVKSFLGFIFKRQIKKDKKYEKNK